MATTARLEPSGRGLPWPITAAVGAVAALTAWLAWAGYYIDDAWISFRYATRLASGAGLSFDDHERVLGTSAALWTVAVAAVEWLGLDTTDAARLLGAAAYVASVVLAAVLAHRLLGGDRRGVAAALAAAALLVAPAGYRNLALSGMESGLAAALGLGAVWALSGRRPVLGGVLAGLAVVNKLDALVLLAALLLVATLLDRRPPWSMAAAAGAAMAPWLAFATWYYGSPVPQSFRSKYDDGAQVASTWAVEALMDRRVALLALVGLVWVVARWQRWPPASRAVGGVLALWFVGHLAAITVIDLGYAWTWYLTVLLPPVAVLGAAAVVDLALVVRDRGGALASALLLVAALGFALAVTEQAGDTAMAITGRDVGGGSALIEQDLLDAGALIEANSEDGDVVESCLGTIQFATLSQPQIDFCGLSTVEEPGPPTWYVRAYYEFGATDPPPPAGFRPVADFTSSCERGLDPLWLRVFVREGSDADRRAPHDSGPVASGCAR